MNTTPTVRIQVDGATLVGTLSVPRGARALVVFVTGGCGTACARRERRVAKHLRRRGIGTLLIDLVAADEPPDRSRRREVGVLAERLRGVLTWLRHRQETASLTVGCYGVGTGGGAVARVLSTTDPGSCVAATVDGRFDREMRTLGSLDRPILFVATTGRKRLERHTRDAYAAVGTDSRDKHLLWADGNDDTVYVTAGWFESCLPTPREAPGVTAGTPTRAGPVGPRRSP